MRAVRGMKSVLEQVLVYGGLLMMVGLLILFGISAAEKGMGTLTGTEPSQATALQLEQEGTKPPTPGKEVAATGLPWSEKLSREIEGSDSLAGAVVEEASLTVGNWLQAGAQGMLGWLQNLLK